MTETLLSDKNPLLKEVRRAAARGSLTSDGFAVAEGFHLLEEALRSRCEIRVVIAADTIRTTVETHVAGLKQTRVVAVSEAVFAALASTETPQGVLALVRPPAWTLAQLVRGRPLVVVLDGVQDPGNAGAIVRAAEAFGATGVAFLKGSVNPYNPKCLRASAGSAFRLPVVAALEESLLIAALEQKRATLYAALPRAEKLISEADLTGNCALVIGSEGRGSQRAPPARVDRPAHSHICCRVVECRRGRRRALVRSAPPAGTSRERIMSLFDSAPAPEQGHDAGRPLAERMRPERLEDFVGQKHILGPGKPLRVQIERDQLTIADPVGSSGGRQDHAGASDRHAHPLRIHPLQRRPERHQGDQGRDGGRRAPPPPGPPHGGIRG